MDDVVFSGGIPKGIDTTFYGAILSSYLLAYGLDVQIVVLNGFVEVDEKYVHGYVWTMFRISTKVIKFCRNVPTERLK